MNIELDEGYSFGLGLFETILLCNNKPIFLDEHLKRINNSLLALEIPVGALTKEEVENHLKNTDSLSTEKEKKEVLKVIISEKNRIFLRRDYPYKKEDFNRGFKVYISPVLRNETSIFTYHKSLNYGENILEKRNAKKNGYDEPIFLNSKEQITEGATTNIFFIKNNIIYTPKISCGLLNGTLRKYIISNYEVIEKDIYLNEIGSYDEIFLTNSLLGIMPVSQFAEQVLSNHELTKKLMIKYNNEINK